MELKVSLYLKSGYVISDTGSDLDQESIEQWLNEFTSGEKEWIQSVNYHGCRSFLSGLLSV